MKCNEQRLCFFQGCRKRLARNFRYTSKHWGAGQARTYAQRIGQAAESLAAGQGAYKDWGTVLDGLRVKAVGSHYSFGVQRQEAPFLVLAIFHDRMDLMQRLMSRLK